MKTYPELTWEWLEDFCDNEVKFFETLRELTPLPETSEFEKRWLVLNKKLRTVVSKLREHPQLKDYVPMKSANCLRWFPAENREVWLDLGDIASDYSICVVTDKIPVDYEVNEQKRVLLDQVADEIYAYITKLRDD